MKKRPEKNKDTWYKLDNAANIYPAVTTNKNTNVFRLSCHLNETVDGLLLQDAADIAIKSFPDFRVVMRRGLFWHYLEGTQLTPVVMPEAGRPCARNYYISDKCLLFSITYFQSRINLEVFHVIADGTGAMELLRAIVYHYLVLSHPHTPLPAPDIAPPSLRKEDSFQHYYNPQDKARPRGERAYTLAGTSFGYNTIGIIEAQVSTRDFLALAKSEGVTATAYIAALLIYSIYRELLPKRLASRTIGAIIPVDLRGRFVSETTRNFFGVANVSYNFSRQPDGFDDVLRSVSEQMTQKLRTESLAGRFNYTMGVQKNIFARFTPLLIKNFVLNRAYQQSERAVTCAVSNMGRIPMPEALAPYIDRFCCLLNPTPLHKLKICVCSYGDKFVLSFTSNIAETKAQKHFIRHLTDNGLDVCITCNGVYDDEIL